MRAFFTIFLAVTAVSYASAPIPIDELPIITAAVQYEIQSSDVSKRRPILLLDETDNWMPPEEEAEEDLDKYPEHVREDIIRQIEEKRVPNELRPANKSRYSLKGLQPPSPSVLHKTSDFKDDYRKTSSFRKVVEKLGKEPFVIRVSRPYTTEDGKAVLLLHALSTWSGCGGLSLVKLNHSENGWKVTERHVLIIW